MTIRTILTNEEESKRLEAGDQRFVIRTEKEFYPEGSFIKFRMMKQGRTQPCKLQHRTFMVTGIATHATAPVEAGYQLISFKEVRK